jgi:hypothetical protein
METGAFNWRSVLTVCNGIFCLPHQLSLESVDATEPDGLLEARAKQEVILLATGRFVWAEIMTVAEWSRAESYY